LQAHALGHPFTIAAASVPPLPSVELTSPVKNQRYLPFFSFGFAPAPLSLPYRRFTPLVLSGAAPLFAAGAPPNRRRR
jgi:hypothetical protein